jgi:DNA-binding transcriptional regulator YdaS (Cro superfamily)
MNLKTYLSAERGRATWLATQLVGVSTSYLSQMASGKAPISPERCVQIEQATGGEVTRQELCPENWQAIWPELTKLPATKPRRAQVTPP